MKKHLALFLAFIMVFTLAACGKTDEKTAGGEGKKYKVGLVAKNQTDQFTAWQANELVKACEEKYNDKFEIEMIDGGGDNAKIIAGMETFISKGVDVIFVQPNDTESLIPTINQAYENDIIVITLGEKVEDGKSTSILSSEFSMGELLGKAAAETLSENANIVIIEGQAGLSVVVDRTEGIKSGLSSRDDVNILVLQNANWERDKAMYYMEDWLTIYDDIDGVLSHDDIMLLGAVNAIQNANRMDEFSFLGGIDGLPEGCEAVKSGLTTVSVAQDAPSQAVAAFEMVLQTLGGGAQEDREVDTELITKENVDKWITIHKESGNM
ncbi:sugar ABC transporter substrate-binding protein [Paratissierella segnis]|uniref:Sugar ABC transporter substrate-binding protein n=1 Tax=Paratissierella segnis TaxID=2763679 RepID=A0A926EVE7_9FIRM|nr:sugar ABC transporter substrate-binding protein [Paratissierella segnis]MBC8586945.1 sugar ABC transporter substrate-binding protein [Paratissierella segnis]